MEILSLKTNEGFIEANTQTIDLPLLQEQTIIPAFAKDNESTISHIEFVEKVYEAASHVFATESISEPTVKVSHPIRGRVPEAKGKPVKELLDHEKTLYYERMAFMIEIPSIQAKIGDDRISLSVGGVRAYNLENLYNKKSPEKFKIFIGFKNWVCTNLCVSTDGFLSDLRVSSLHDLLENAVNLFQSFNIDREVQQMQQMQRTQIDHEQFAHIIGRAKQYLNLPKDLKATKENFPLGDSQLSQMIREYYQDQSNEYRSMNLWEFYNLMTSANKSSYIDAHVDRVVDSFRFTQSLGNSLENQLPNWYTHSIYYN
jgi:hypothetical protein